MLRRWAPLASAVAVVAIVVAVSLVFSHRGGSGVPPALRLAAGSAGDTAAAADAPLAAGKRAAGGSSFTLVGPLPPGPDEARAQELPRGAAKADDVRRLASALGVKGEPTRVEKAWQVGGLRVEDAAGHPWSLSIAYACPDVPVASDSTVSSDGSTSSGSSAACLPGLGAPGTTSSGGGSAGSDPAAGSGSVSTGSGSAPAGANTTTDAAPPPPDPAITACPDNARCAAPGWVPPAQPSPGPTADVNAARRAAAAVLAALGMKDADMDVEGAGEHVFVRVDPRVDGLPTSGYTTFLEIDAESSVVGGGGYLGRPSSGPSYPLVSAKSAFDDLPEPPRILIACAQAASCPQPEPAQVTGAELGLMLTALADEEAALLPAWLFAVKGWPMPLAQPAIEPRFLTLPKDEPVQVDPGLVDPPQVDPAQPTTPVEPNKPAATRSSFGFDAVFPTDDPSGIVVQYGDSGSCPHTNVTPVVKESRESVVVVLEADSMPAGQACTDDYHQQLVPLTLKGPLGDRKVIDGSTGSAVAVDRTCSRPMGAPAPPKSCERSAP